MTTLVADQLAQICEDASKYLQAAIHKQKMLQFVALSTMKDTDMHCRSTDTLFVVSIAHQKEANGKDADSDPPEEIY